MITTAWAHLPNAPHIDRILAHFKAHPDRWGAAWDAARDAAWGAARDAARGAARHAAWDTALDAIWDAARGAARGAAWGAAWDAAWGAMSALIAWDDCAGILDMPVDAVRFLAANGHQPAILLLPAVLAMEEK
jgi:hypothetical protein